MRVSARWAAKTARKNYSQRELRGYKLKKQIFRMRHSLTVIVILLLIQTNVTAAPLILSRPVPLQTETMAHLKQAHATKNDQWQLVVFGFTHCKDICPTSLANLAMLIRAADDEQIKLNGTFVSIDPDRDTGAALSDYTKSFGPGIAHLRLEDEELEQFKATFGVEVAFYTKNEGNQSNYQVDHSTTAFLIDPEGRIKVMFDAVLDATSVADMFQENKELFNS
jgi:protein SCO1